MARCPHIQLLLSFPCASWRMQLRILLLRPRCHNRSNISECAERHLSSSSLDFFLRPVSQIIIGRGMRRQPVHHRFDQCRAFAGYRPIARFLHCSIYFQRIVTVDTQSGEPVSDRPIGIFCRSTACESGRKSHIGCSHT